MGRAREGYFLYKYVYRDEIIYIGRTTNIVNRIQTHAKGQGLDEKLRPYLDEAEIYIHECSTETVMKSLESLLIEAHKPMLNIQGKTEHQLKCTISDISWTLYNEQDFVETITSPKTVSKEETGPLKKQTLKRTREQLDQILKIVDLCPEILTVEISNDLDDVYNKIKEAAKQQTVIAVTSSNILNLALNNNQNFCILGREEDKNNRLWNNVVNEILDEKSIQQKVEMQNATEEQIVKYLKMPKAKNGDLIREADHDERLYDVRFGKRTPFSSIANYINCPECDKQKLILLVLYLKIFLNKQQFKQFCTGLKRLFKKYRNSFKTIPFDAVLDTMGISEDMLDRLKQPKIERS